MLSGKYAPVKPELTLIESFSLPQEIDRHCSSLRLSLFVFCFSTYLPLLWFNKAPPESFPYMRPTNQYPTQQCAPLSPTLLCLHSALPDNMSILINSTNLRECLAINIKCEFQLINGMQNQRHPQADSWNSVYKLDSCQPFWVSYYTLGKPHYIYYIHITIINMNVYFILIENMRQGLTLSTVPSPGTSDIDCRTSTSV